MEDLLTLGPQFRAPNLREALQRASLGGPVVAITAGWQEREAELGALEEHLGQRVRDLRLYERAEAVFAQDGELQAAYRSRQNDLRQLQDLYRVRLDHAKAAARELFQAPDDSALVRKARRSAIAALRRLDAEHLREIRALHGRFEVTWGAGQRPILARQLADLEQLITAAAVVCIAGGHVAVLLNRLRLFGLGRALRTRPWPSGSCCSTIIRHRARATRNCSKPASGSSVTPYSCRTQPRDSLRAIRSALRCWPGAWPPRSATRSTTAMLCIGAAAGSRLPRARSD